MSRYLSQRFGGYHLVRLLREGNFAEVYKGRIVYLGTSAAVKVLNEALKICVSGEIRK
jgi:serine/threonine protein kinase